MAFSLDDVIPGVFLGMLTSTFCLVRVMEGVIKQTCARPSCIITAASSAVLSGSQASINLQMARDVGICIQCLLYFSRFELEYPYGDVLFFADFVTYAIFPNGEEIFSIPRADTDTVFVKSTVRSYFCRKQFSKKIMFFAENT